MSEKYIVEFLYGDRKMPLITWKNGIFEEEGATELSQDITKFFNQNEKVVNIVFDLSNAMIVIDTAFTILNQLCQVCVQQGCKIQFVKPSLALSDFLSIMACFEFKTILAKQ